MLSHKIGSLSAQELMKRKLWPGHTTQEAIVSERATAGSRKAKSLATNESARRSSLCSQSHRHAQSLLNTLRFGVSDIREYDNATGPRRHGYTHVQRLINYRRPLPTTIATTI
jgi:hypothetical protein